MPDIQQGACRALLTISRCALRRPRRTRGKRGASIASRPAVVAAEPAIVFNYASALVALASRSEPLVRYLLLRADERRAVREAAVEAGRTGYNAGVTSTSATGSRAPMSVWRIVTRYADALRAHVGDRVREVILFGSQARGEGREGSDVDIAVIVTDPGFALRVRIIDLASDIGLETGLDLSPTVIDVATWQAWRRQERPLARDIERDGIRV